MSINQSTTTGNMKIMERLRFIDLQRGNFSTLQGYNECNKRILILLCLVYDSTPPGLT